MTNAKPRKERKYTKKKFAALIVAVVLLSAVISVVITAEVGENRAAYFIRGAFVADGEVYDGLPDIDGIEAVQDIPPGEIRYYINKDIVFSDGYGLGDILLQNPQKCSYALRFFFYLADGSSNVPVYISEVIRPGQYMNGDKLNRYLGPGKYDCTYTVKAYDPYDLSQEMGSLSGLVTITVHH